MGKSNISSYLYKFSERILTHATTFVVSIILARLLSPADYGTLSLIMVFVVFIQVIIEGGLSSALIQKKDTTNKDYDITLTITLLMALAFYLLLCFVSNSLETWLKMQGLSEYIRVVALILFPSALLSIYKAKFVREMMFKTQMYVTFVGAFVSGLVGIVVAYKGYGIWALIVQQMLTSVLMVVLYAFITKWMPKIVFSADYGRVKDLYNYGWKIMMTNLLVRGNNEIMGLAIGKCCSPAVLGLYDRGKQFPQAAAENIESTVQSVLFPILSRTQDDKTILIQCLRRIQIMMSYISFFLLAVIAGASTSFIPILLTDRWSDCIPYLILWCVCYVPSVPSIIAVTAINSVGNSDMTLKRQLLSTIPSLLVCLIVVILTKDVLWVLIAKIIMIPYFYGITSFYLSKSIPYSFKEQMKDILPSFVVSVVVFFGVYGFSYLNMNAYATLSIQCVAACLIIVLFSSLFRLEGFLLIKDVVMGYIKK